MKKLYIFLMATAISLFGLDINSATEADFIKIKGIGKKKAEKIIAYRTEHGNFANIDELKNVKGIGNKIVNIIKSTENSSETKTKKETPKKSKS